MIILAKSWIKKKLCVSVCVFQEKPIKQNPKKIDKCDKPEPILSDSWSFCEETAAMELRKAKKRTQMRAKWLIKKGLIFFIFTTISHYIIVYLQQEELFLILYFKIKEKDLIACLYIYTYIYILECHMGWRERAGRND